MVRLLLITIALSARLCSLRAGPPLQRFVFHSDDPLSITALLSELGAALFLLTAELCVAFFLRTRWPLQLLHGLNGHCWLPAALTLAFIAAITAVVHRFLPARSHRRRCR